jgi:hypothetical protein
MKILQELVRIINRHKLRDLRKLGFPFQEDNRLGQLYEAIAAGEATEEEIAQAVTGHSPQSGRYRRVKADLRERLINALFLVDLAQPSYTDRQRAYYEVYKNWSAAKILLGKNAREAGIGLAERVLRQAEHFEFSPVALDISQTLRLHYGTLMGDAKRYREYEEKCRRLQRIVQAEGEAENVYTALVVDFVNAQSPQASISRQAKRFYETLQPLLQRYDAYTLHWYASLIQLTIFTSVHDYGGAVKVCDEIIHFFSRKPYTAAVPLQVAYYQKLICFLQLRRFDEQEIPVERCLSLLEEGAYNWFRFQETYLLLALHTQQYEVAYQTYLTASTHSRFARLPDNVKEYWRVLEAYLHFLVESGQLPAAAQDQRFSKFRIGRFLNRTPIFSRDKRGVNVSILIIQILFLIRRGKYNETIDKMEAVEQYTRRYLHQQGTMRAFYFLKALLELPKNSFHPVAVARKARPHLERMADHPLEEGGQSASYVEILPFERAWEIILQSL